VRAIVISSLCGRVKLRQWRDVNGQRGCFSSSSGLLCRWRLGEALAEFLIATDLFVNEVREEVAEDPFSEVDLTMSANAHATHATASYRG
jgi:hypothetical protein